MCFNSSEEIDSNFCVGARHFGEKEREGDDRFWREEMERVYMERREI